MGSSDHICSYWCSPNFVMLIIGGNPLLKVSSRHTETDSWGTTAGWDGGFRLHPTPAYKTLLSVLLPRCTALVNKRLFHLTGQTFWRGHLCTSLLLSHSVPNLSHHRPSVDRDPGVAEGGGWVVSEGREGSFSWGAKTKLLLIENMNHRLLSEGPGGMRPFHKHKTFPEYDREHQFV